jgi:hypothetical protein
MKIAICLPTRGAPSREHENCLLALARSRPSWEIIRLDGCPCVDVARALLAEEALETGAEVLLSIDSDTVFTVDDCDAVVGQAYEFECVVGAAYARKSEGSQIALLWDGRALTFYEGGGLEPVRSVGLGFTAAHRAVFEKIDIGRQTFNDGKTKRVLRPFYTNDVRWSEIGGEDDAFMRRVRESGSSIFCDTRIRVGHEGRKVYYLEDSAPQKLVRTLTIKGST